MNPTHQTPRRRVLRTLAIAATALACIPAFAQSADWPKAGPIKFVVPFTAGSGTDIIARTVAEKLAPLLGAQIVIENRPGAGGTLGASMVAKGPADGYMVLIHSSGHLVNPSLYPKLNYDTLKDFSGVTPLASLPNVLVVAPSKGIKDLADLVARAKAKPGSFNYASAGNGSATHMNAEQFRVSAGIQAQHVPFRGTPEAITETIAGRTDWFFAPLVSALPLIKDGKLQALAVGTHARSPVLAGVPSISESGLKDAAYQFWVGMFIASKTPKAIVDRLHDETVKVLEMPDVRERIEKLGAAPMPMAQAAFDKFLDDETRAASTLVKSAGIRIE